MEPHTGRLSSGRQSYAGGNSTRTRLETARRWKFTSRCTRGPVPRWQTFALWQAGSSQQLPIGMPACSVVGSAGLTGGQRRSKLEEASDCQEVARFMRSLLADPPCHRSLLLHTSPKRMHDQLDRGSTARCCLTVYC